LIQLALDEAEPHAAEPQHALADDAALAERGEAFGRGETDGGRA
jgi:hypothetical protein